MIFRRLLPRQGKFYELFNEHGARIGAGAQAFLALVEHYDDPARRAQHAAEVDSAERSADRVTAEVVRSLHRTVFTPIGRDQILGLINAMDDVLDRYEAYAGRMPFPQWIDEVYAPSLPQERARP